MTKNGTLIIRIVSGITLIFPILFLLKLLEANIAFPLMFIMLGIQQILFGVFKINESKKSRTLNYIFGVFFIIFALGIVLPYYIFPK